MVVVVVISLIAILMANLESRGQMKNGMFYGFFLVTLLGCIHYNYGNDYMGYYSTYKEINIIPLRWDYLAGDAYNIEPGWVVLNHLFSHFGGFFMMVAVLNVFQNAVYYHFIKNNVRKREWTISMIIYLMSGSLYILNFSMMRQGLAISLFVLAWSFIRDKKLIQTLIIIGIASSIHYSAQILFPFALLPFAPLGKRTVSFIYVGLLIALYFSSELLSNTFEAISAVEELKSTQTLGIYAEDTEKSSYGLGFVINLLPFVISIWGLFMRNENLNNEKKMLIMISMVSFLIAPFGQIIPLLGRFGMYFSAYDVAVIPFIYSLLPNKKYYQIFMGVYIFILVYSYYMFFHSPVWAKSYSTFHTIFEIL